jgi:hypothetical protein
MKPPVAKEYRKDSFSVSVTTCWSRVLSSLFFKCRGFRHYAAIRKVAGLIPSEVIGFYSSPNPSNRILALGLTQPFTEMGTRYLPGGKERPALRADNLTAI